ncbi:MAG: protein kinase [Acidobacteria bacterium]|nr:protein kinase [Acidobacteriota bacterium]
MTPERWELVKELFEKVVDVPPAERSSLLRAAADAELVREVEGLLEADARSESFLAMPAGSLLGAMEAIGRWRAPERLGPYRLLGEIGAGGMGTVHLAERDDDTFRMRVAIKIVRAGAGSQGLLRRFVTERQILAGLEHPGIARLLDGGSAPDGGPYLVMEYVEGLPIDVHCTRRRLSVRQRIELFRKVCAAVAYAHQHLVVHRDLKPGNILVTEGGLPKLLDFGIATLFQPGRTETATALHALTPGYASPEQIEGRGVATTSDVYSLGVVLFELLTGALPYRTEGRSPLELARAVCEEQPQVPSAVAKGEALDADLDNIVLMALRKDPARRHPSVESLDDDLKRYLEGLPVKARPDTFTYRTGKLLKRKRLAVAAALLVALSVLGGVLATLHEARIADRRFREVHRLANALIFELHDGIQGITGSTRARELLVKRALEYLAMLSREAPDDPAIQKDLAAAYEKIGDIQGRPGIANLGQYEAALRSYEESLRLRRKLLASHPGDEELQKAIAASTLRKGHVLADRGRLTEALESYEEGTRILEPLHTARPDDPVVARDLGVLHMLSGDVLGHPHRPSLGRPEEALERYLRGHAIQRRLLSADPKSGERRHFLASHTGRLAAAEGALGRFDDASRHFREATDLLTALKAEFPRVGSIRSDLAFLETAWAGLLVESDRDRALALLAGAEATLEELAARDAANAAAREDRAALAVRVADLVSPFDPARARREYERAIPLYAEILAGSPGRARVVYPAARAHAGLGERSAAVALLEDARRKGNQDVRAEALLAELVIPFRPPLRVTR